MTPTTLDPLDAAAFQRWLHQHDACQEARTWAAGKDFATAWATCDRGDWLLWLLDCLPPLDAKLNEALVCRFAREVVHLTSDPRVLACIEVREAWIRGEATDAARAAAGAAAWAAARAAAARDAAREAAAGAAAWDAAWDATWHAARAAAGDAAGDAAKDAAWHAARAAARAAAGDAAREAAGAAAWAKQAIIVRELVAIPTLFIS